MATRDTQHNSEAQGGTWEQARALLGVAADAGEVEIRAAYMEKVRQHPPDRDPEQFERVRDAYDQLRDPRLRARQVLVGPYPVLPLTSLVEGVESPRRFVAARLWLDVLKEKRS